jgi:hypothetical protein
VVTIAQSVAWTSFAVRSPPRKLSERLMETGIRARAGHRRARLLCMWHTHLLPSCLHSP